MPTLNPACLFVRFDCILISIVDLSISFFSEINENHQIINIKKLIVFVFTEHGRVKKKKKNEFFSFRFKYQNSPFELSQPWRISETFGERIAVDLQFGYL